MHKISRLGPAGLLIVVSAGALLAIDLAVPLGIACTAPYAAVIVLSLWLPHRNYIVVTAGVVSVLIVAGLFLSPPGGPFWNGVANRTFSLTAVWAVAIAALQRRKLIARMRSDQRRLRQMQSLELIGKLAAGVVHDLNNIMTVIVGNVELALGSLDAAHPAREEVEEVQKASARCSHLTRQLMALSSRRPSVLKRLDLNSILGDFQQLLRRLVGEDLEWVVETDPRLGQIRADRGRIEQVILNLVLNARDAMPGGGKLIIETANVSFSPPQGSAGDIPGVMLSVADTGAGMDSETLSRIFEPFFTTKDFERGTGLGLATVNEIVDSFGGKVTVESIPGEGTIFRVYIPRLESTDADHPAPIAEAPPARGSETVLIVEDETGILALTRRVLESAGYSVLAARDGEGAVQLAQSHTGPLHLLLTDVELPGISGVEVADRLRRRISKVLYVSAHPRETLTAKGLIGSENHFLQKPFAPDALSRKIRQVLEAQGTPGLRESACPE